MAEQKLIEIGKIVPPTVELEQFWRYQGKTYCFRPKCEGCKYEPTCQRELVQVKVGPGINIRRAFRARPGFKLAAIDYKGIELRVAGQLSGEPFFINAFREGKDLHTEMAKLCFKCEVPTKSQRDQAKTCNFGNLFLGNPYTLARQSNLTIPEAIYLHGAWWKNLPTYKRWTDSQLVLAKAQKKVTTFFGRVRDLTSLIAEAEGMEIKGDGKKKKTGAKGGWGFVHRTAVNSPVQGTAADLMKLAMVRVHDFINREGLNDKIRLLLTVHDELVFEIIDGPELPVLARAISKEMCPDLSKFGWIVPIETDIEIGDNWADMLDIKDIEKGFKIDPHGSTTTTEDVHAAKDREARLVVNARLNQVNMLALNNAILKASKVGVNVVGVPIKIQIGGSIYKSGDPELGESVVNLPLLERLVQEIPGVQVVHVAKK
jgi:hypothetical protein